MSKFTKRDYLRSAKRPRVRKGPKPRLKQEIVEEVEAVEAATEIQEALADGEVDVELQADDAALEDEVNRLD